MKVKVTAAAGLVLILAVVAAPLAFAQVDGTGGSAAVTATLSGILGTRVVTSVAPIAMSSVVDTSTLTTTYAVVVTEAARTGTNPWSVTGSISGGTLNDLASHTIPSSALAISGRAVAQVGSGGTSAAAGGSADLGSAVTLFTNTGQVTTSAYTGTHTATGSVTLTPPNGTPNGVYTGTFVVTLVQ